MPTTIKDPVHGYIELDAFEEKVVDSPWFQRLRRVRQNDVCSIVYPTMGTARFEHSLGAMHLAGGCMRAALEDEASQANVDRFLRFLGGELRGLGIEVARERLPLFARQCARMYGALHDIGHPPYSHLIESCFTAAEIGLPAGTASHWHEENGARIVREHLPASIAASGEDANVLRVVAELARKDLPTPALVAIKQLVDSVVDVDRMDFVLRDGRASGSEFGTYDLRRLVSSFRVHVVELNGAAQQILIRPLNKALSAIESLIQERYKLYRWVLFHHRVMQSRALMRFVMRSTRRGFSPRQLLAANYVPVPSAGSAEQYPYALLGDGVVEQHLDRQLHDLRLRETSLSRDEARVLCALRILVLRQDMGVPLWKRTDVYNGVRDDTSFEMRLRAAFAGVSLELPHQRVIRAHGSYANWVATKLRTPGDAHYLQEIENRLNAGPDEEWYLLEVPAFSRTGDDRVLVAGDRPGEFRSAYLSDISTVAVATDEARRNDVHLFAFAFANRSLAGPERQGLQARGRGRLATVIADMYQASATMRKDWEPPPL
jgi:hypothetical protein